MYILRIHFPALIFHSVSYMYLPIPTTSLPSEPLPASVDSEEGFEGSAHSARALRSLDREHQRGGQAPKGSSTGSYGAPGAALRDELCHRRRVVPKEPTVRNKRSTMWTFHRSCPFGCLFKKIIFNLIASREGIFKLYMQKVLKKKTLYLQKKSLKN